MENNDRELTQLETKLLQKVKFIEQFILQRKYMPKRVEPGIGFELDVESKWSKYLGETLFINQKLLQEKIYQESIFWREAFLLFVQATLRNSWWVRLIADAFPLSIKLSNAEHNEWEKLWKEVSPEYTDLIEKLKLIIASAGSEGLIKVLNQCMDHVLHQHDNKIELGIKGVTRFVMDPHEFELIISNIQFESVTISESAVDIMSKALIRQTTKSKEISKFTEKHPTVVAKTITKLLAMNILRRYYNVDYSSLGLTQYLALLICTKQQSEFFRKAPKNPFLFSHKFNCLNICVITQYYVAPKSELFYNNIVNYCKELKNQNKIVGFYSFEIVDSYRSYTFKYFKPKTKTQDININDLAIESRLFNADPISNLPHTEQQLDNIKVNTRTINSKITNIDLIDLKILNQFISGNVARRIIQKNIKKDMNEVVRRIKYLFDKSILYEDVQALLPESNSEINVYIEDISTIKLDNTSIRSLKDRIKRFSYYLPNVYFAELNGSFDGMLFRSFLPSSTTLKIADFFNRFLPNNVNTQIILGASTFQKDRGTFDETRWNNGQWLFDDEDFKF